MHRRRANCSVLGAVSYCKKKYMYTRKFVLIVFIIVKQGRPGGSEIKNLLAKQETQVWPLGWEDPLEKELAPHSSVLAGESHGQRSLVGYSP